jgi:TIR domain-containing protein
LLKLRLEREGRDAWVDSDRLDPGIDWRMEIDQAIQSARAVLAIMSPDARASEYVTYEWAFAWGCGKKVIPIMLRPTTLHPRLATLQYLDFTNRIARPWTRLYNVLSGLP